MTTEIKIAGIYEGDISNAIETLNNVKSYTSWWPYENEMLDSKSMVTQIPELCTEIQLEKLVTMQKNIVSLCFTKGFLRGVARFIMIPNDKYEHRFQCVHYATLYGAREKIDKLLTSFLFKKVYADYIGQILLAAGFKLAKIDRNTRFETMFNNKLFIPSQINMGTIAS